jgi:hypothetical protein
MMSHPSATSARLTTSWERSLRARAVSLGSRAHVTRGCMAEAHGAMLKMGWLANGSVRDGSLTQEVGRLRVGLESHKGTAVREVRILLRSNPVHDALQL